MSTLYVLQLEDNKWYVGKTDDVNKRFEQHKTGKGSEWTKEYRPIKIAETRPITSAYDETNTTKDLMKKYGIDNVRGGAYCRVDLTEEQETMIRHEIRSNDDKCYKCGKPGHFANRCKGRSSFTGTCECGTKFLDFDEFMNHMKGCKVRNANIKQVKSTTPSKQSGKCFRCGRSGHWATSCYARTHVDGYDLDSDDSEYDSE